MNKITNIAVLFLLATSCYAQRTITIEQRAVYYENRQDLPEMVEEINDVNNVLDEFVGSWSTNYDGKTISIQVVKEREVTNFRGVTLSEDLLNFSYEIKDSNGVILASSTQAQLGDCKGLTYLSDGTYVFYLYDACEMDKAIYLKPYISFPDPNIRNEEKREMQFIVSPPLLGGLDSDPNDNSNCVSVANYLPPVNTMIVLDKQ
ncbi:hypothetical protein LX97_00393 [Nonlabens dokdonensis]|uniref:DUF6705 domain-containing protein n=2 Tax=Nonlabens dokdonensis TaxID=328515 RepID=L7W7E2_NONDD|nr:DUF6705 family protein [Nonlabens dokdonensis]AGC75706.1 hypothetical protein DDD_0579 [Nonlabens dokdonensis DSW-6]PZX43393.1 hypothetical protein LX97_00393 [Nonlabens dokdonensis]